MRVRIAQFGLFRSDPDVPIRTPVAPDDSSGIQAFIEQPVRVSGVFAADLPTLAGAAPVGFLARKSSMPSRLLLAVTDGALHAVEPGIGWKARRLAASWNLSDVRAGRNGARLVLTVPGFWVVALTPLGAPARQVVDRLCDRVSVSSQPSC